MTKDHETPTATSAVSDEQLARAAYKGYDDYWTEDSKGIQSEAWAASAKAVLALAQPAPVQAGAQQAVADLLEAVDGVLESAPCECSHKRRYDDGEHMSGCYLFDLNIARQSLAAPTQAGAGDTKGGA